MSTITRQELTKATVKRNGKNGPDAGAVKLRSKAQTLREQLHDLNIADSIAAFSKMLVKPSGEPYARGSIYAALKNPKRYPLLSRRINKIINQ